MDPENHWLVEENHFPGGRCRAGVYVSFRGCIVVVVSKTKTSQRWLFVDPSFHSFRPGWGHFSTVWLCQDWRAFFFGEDCTPESSLKLHF